MRTLVPIAVVGLLGLALSGCAVVEVASAGVDVATTVVSTTVSVAKGAVDTVAGDSDDSDHHRHKDGNDDDSDK
ncbi:MAG: hypothetical protein ACREPT_04330 [Rudaea sp.]